MTTKTKRRRKKKTTRKPRRKPLSEAQRRRRSEIHAALGKLVREAERVEVLGPDAEAQIKERVRRQREADLAGATRLAEGLVTSGTVIATAIGGLAAAVTEVATAIRETRSALVEALREHAIDSQPPTGDD